MSSYQILVYTEMNTTQNPKAVVEVQMHEPNEACPVCQETLGQKNVVTTECGHKFHYTCLLTWNNENTIALVEQILI